MEPVKPLPRANSAEANAEVLVAGAGPVGLMLACLLKQAGVDVALVDPHVLPAQGSKAAVTMPRTFEQLELAGVDTKGLCARARTVESGRMSVGGGEWTAEISGMRYPSVASRQLPRTVGQDLLEEALNRRYLELGGRFYRGARFVSYKEVADGIEVQLEHAPYLRPPAVLPPMPASVTATMATTMFAKYMVGCDGKNSNVRAAMGTSYDGHDYTETFLLADVEVPEAEVQRSGFDKHVMNSILDSQQGSFLLFVRLQETRWRTYLCQRGLTREELTPEFIQEKWKQLVPPPGPFVPTEFKELAFFEVACKLAGNYHKGRVFLAGDAAHCHSPAGGQGMNTGVQDSANLAWKIASVLRGHASANLLDSYELERKPIAKWVLSTSDGMFQQITTQLSRAKIIARRLFLKTIFSLIPPTALPPKFLLNAFFGLSQSYADNGTCRQIGTAPPRGSIRAGDRLPDLECKDLLSASSPNVFTLELLSSPPYTALHVMLVAETSRGLPSSEEIESAMAGINVLQSLAVPLKPLIYMASSAVGCFTGLFASKKPSPPELTVGTGSSMVRMLVPVNADAKTQSPCAEIITLLGLGVGGKAVLVVRPDGYIAVEQLGSWDLPPVVTALEELGVVSRAA
jgi:2-polyprenyl-6-methoxyphenol hydroxylase-like FAD-dependent oxidoreductase